MNYYAKFIPQAAAHMAPLYKLFQKEQKWVWTEECDSAFQTFKEMLTSEAILVHYDSNRPIKLACDASSYGLGLSFHMSLRMVSIQWHSHRAL